MRRTMCVHGGRSVLVVLVFALLGLPAVALAEPAGNPFEFAREAVDDPEVASVQSGRALTVWGTGGDPAFRVLSPASAIGDRLQAAAGGTTYGTGGRIAANPRLEQYLHVWSSYVLRDQFSQVTLYSQPRDAAGTALADPVIVYQVEAAGIVVHDLVWNQHTRRFLLLWATTDDAPSGVHATLLDESGAPISHESMDVEGNASAAAAAVRPRDGSYLVSWSDGVFDPAAGTYRRIIRGQRLDVTGRTDGPAFEVSAHSNLVGLVENEHPSIAMDPQTGGGIVVWTDQYEVFGRRINARAAPTGSDLRLSRMGAPSDPAWLTRSPDIAYNTGAKQYVVVWQSGPARDPYPAGEVVYGQHLNRDGDQIGANDFAIATRDRAIEPSITALAGGSDFLVAWSSHLNRRTGWARRVTPTTQGPPVRPPESDPTPDQPPLVPPVPSVPTIPGLPDVPVGGASGPPVTPPNALPPAPATAPASPSQPDGITPVGGPRDPESLRSRMLGGTRIRVFTRTGLRALLSCASPCRVTARLTISRRDARRLGTSRTLARKVLRIGDRRSATVTLRPPSKAVRQLRRLARLNATLSVKSVEAGGVVRRLERRVRLVR